MRQRFDFKIKKIRVFLEEEFLSEKIASSPQTDSRIEDNTREGQKDKLKRLFICILQEK